MSENEQTHLQAGQAGQQYLDRLLMLRHFPSPDEARRGQDSTGFYIYSTDAIENHVDQTFAGQITLLGYNRQENLQIEPYWQVAAPPEHDFQVFVHLVSLNSGEIIAQDDGTPAQPAYPTSNWDTPGEIVIGQIRTIHLPPDLPRGQYRLLLGLYNLQTGMRLITADGSDSILLDTITLPLGEYTKQGIVLR